MNRCLGFLLLLGYVAGKPASFDEYLALEDDIASIGSMRRDVRAPAPVGFATEVADLLGAGSEARTARQAKGHKEPKKTTMKNASGKSDEGGYYKTYGSDADGEKGYLKQTYSKGDHGYKTLDTFHKQDGDNYGFEKHTAFGKAKGAEEGGKHGKSGAYKNHEDSHDDDHEGAGTIVDTHYAPAATEGDHAGYSEGEHYSEGDAAEGDAAYYSEGGSDSGHYSDGGEGGHHVSGGEGDSGSYSTGGSSGEHYSSGSGGEGSHGTHGSYSTGGESGDHQGYEDGGYEGAEHY